MNRHIAFLIQACGQCLPVQNLCSAGTTSVAKGDIPLLSKLLSGPNLTLMLRDYSKLDDYSKLMVSTVLFHFTFPCGEYTHKTQMSRPGRASGADTDVDVFSFFHHCCNQKIFVIGEEFSFIFGPSFCASVVAQFCLTPPFYRALYFLLIPLGHSMTSFQRKGTSNPRHHFMSTSGVLRTDFS